MAAERMVPYRDTRGWAVFVEACPELSLPEDSDEEDWRVGLAKVRALPAVKSEVAAAFEVPVVAKDSAVATSPALAPSPSAAPASSSTLPLNTSPAGPLPRLTAIEPVARAPSLSPVRVLQPSSAASLPVVLGPADPLPLSEESEEEDEEEVAADDSDEDEIVELTADGEAIVEVDDVEKPAAQVVPAHCKTKKPVQGSRQAAKDFPTEIRPEDTPLGAYRAGSELVVCLFLLF